jgi:hypothetical protein
MERSIRVEDKDLILPSEEWLETVDAKMGSEGVPYRQRPFQAIRTWSLENDCPVWYGTEFAGRIFAWFEQHSAPGSHNIGGMYTGVFYFDAYFWPVEIPLAYGRVNLDALDSLGIMPSSIKARLSQHRGTLIEYMGLWTDCLDFGYGCDDIEKSRRLAGFAGRLFASADHQLRATVSLLTEHEPNAKAMDSARMTTEMFLKTFLAAHGALTEPGAVKIGHDLRLALTKCLEIKADSELRNLAGRVEQFPGINSRYDGRIYTPSELWLAYGTSQIAASATVRSLSNRNARGTIEGRLGQRPRA